MIRYKDFADLLNRMVASSASKTALLADKGDGDVYVVSWADFEERVKQRADFLTEQGDTCEAILADGTLECVVEVFAAVRAGLQVALVDPMMPNRILVPLLRSVDADCVWAANNERKETLEYELKPGATAAFGAHGMLFFTSGTTSASKAVVLTDSSLMSSAFNGSALLPLAPSDILLCLLPLSHVFGFVCGLLWGLSCGATVALGRGPRHYADDFELFKPTTVAVVPTLLEHLVVRSAFNDALKLVLVGAADCSAELLSTVRRRGIRVSLGYGLTETSSGIALSTGDDFHAMTICPEYSVTIADNGEVLAHAPTCVMQGYYRDAEKTAATIRGGVLHTGDKGAIDKYGLLHVEGRLSDVLTLPGGTKVFLPEYENAAASALGERDVMVLLQQGKLTIVCGQLAQKWTDHELTEALKPAMEAYPPGSRIAKIVHLGHALPRTPAGDIERWKIQEELTNRKPG